MALANESQDDKVNERQLKGLANLLLIQSRFRNADNVQVLGFLAVNDTRLLITYDDAYFFTKKPSSNRKKLTWLSANNAPDVDTGTPFSSWLNALVKECVFSAEKNNINTISRQTLTEKESSLLSSWAEYAPDNLLVVPLVDHNNQIIGTTLFFRKKAWTEPETRVLVHWQESLSYSLSTLYNRSNFSVLKKITSRQLPIAMTVCSLFLAALFIPVKQSVLAPAEIVPTDPLVIRSPLSGTIDDVLVKPNTMVKKGDLLLSLNKSALQTELEIARQSLVIIETELLQARQAAFNDTEAKSLIVLLKLKQQKADMEVNYLRELLSRADVIAKRSGLVVMTDAHRLIGQSVSIGESLLKIADPQKSQLHAWLTVGDNIVLNNNKMEFFSSSSPDKPLSATLSEFNYEAEDYEGQLAYRLTGHWTKIDKSARVGQRGTVRIIGDKVSLGYYLFRKPLAYVRQSLGL